MKNDAPRVTESEKRTGRPRTKNSRLMEPGSWLDVVSTSCARPGHRGVDQKRPIVGEGSPVAGWTLVAPHARPEEQKRPNASGSSLMERRKIKGRSRGGGGAAGAGGQGTRSASEGRGERGKEENGWVGRVVTPCPSATSAG